MVYDKEVLFYIIDYLCMCVYTLYAVFSSATIVWILWKKEIMNNLCHWNLGKDCKLIDKSRITKTVMICLHVLLEKTDAWLHHVQKGAEWDVIT